MAWVNVKCYYIWVFILYGICNAVNWYLSNMDKIH